MKCASLFGLLISIGIIAVLFSTISNSVFSFTPEEEAVLEKAQKSVNAQKPQGDNIATPNVSNKTDSSSGYNNYDNQTYGVKVKYPVDWTPRHHVLDRKSSPETIFDVAFFSPFENVVDFISVSISIDRLDPITTTLEKYKDRIIGNLKNGYPDVKDITISKDTLAGRSAYKIENMINMVDHWEKSVDVYSVENGTLYDFSVLGKPELIKNYSAEIKKMTGSVEIEQPRVNFQQIYEAQVSKIKQLSSQPNRYVNEKCGVSIMLPKGFAAIPSDFVHEDVSKTLADFQSADDDIFSLYISIQNIGYWKMSPTDIADSLRDYASLNPDSNILESNVGQIGGFPSYKIVYSEGSPGRHESEKDRFYTLDILIIAYDREYRFVFEAADKGEFDKYRSSIENMAKTIKINEPKFEGINCQ